MKVIVVDDYKEMSKKASILIANEIILNPKSVLGLATGGTPLGTYKELIKFYKEGIIDFSDVITFNLDEYYGLPYNNQHSYHYYMIDNFFKHINIKLENTYIPNGMTENIEAECQFYDNKIEEMGGIDIQLLGIGVNGHIGFNEPNIVFEAKTHLVELDQKTIRTNARYFEREDDVPRKAITMGVKNIMQSKKVVLLAYGSDKADAIKKTVEGNITPEIPSTILQLHPNTTLIIDKKAAAKLSF